MKSSVLIICAILFINSCLFSQKNESVIVKAGTRLIDYFPVADRYLYADFTKGEAIFKNERIYPSAFNYNFLTGEMEFIKSNDTLFITVKRDLLSIVVAQDTFYYHKGYLQMIRSGKIKVWLKQSIAMKDIRKKGAMGTINRSAASESYVYLLISPMSRDLVADIDMVFKKEEVYFFSTSGEDFFRFNRNNIIQILPEDIVKNYLKLNKIDFVSREDLLRLADFVSKFLGEK
ncbi:MAG TPA: hypothetical protein VLA03_05270 [Draconibacterium sp.]|nr:hypothetical protein [Draconibacterium sp.]